MLTRVESGFEVSEGQQLTGRADVAEVSGIVVDLDDLVATVEMGADGEEWVFPRSMLPTDIEVDSVLTFDGVGSSATVVAHRHPAPSVEDRMERALIRRRMQPR
ncbi:MAG: hypothetical protein ACXV8G_00635 [Acidimicrobiales bacterium]